MPPQPPCPHPHTLADYSHVLRWKLTIGTGANYHLPLAVNGFLVPGTMWDRCRAGNSWNGWPGSQTPACLVNEDTPLTSSGLAGIMAQKVAPNLLIKDSENLSHSFNLYAHKHVLLMPHSYSRGDHMCTFCRCLQMERNKDPSWHQIYIFPR